MQAPSYHIVVTSRGLEGAWCHNCGKVGHIRKTCRKQKNPGGGGQVVSQLKSYVGAWTGTGLYSKQVLRGRFKTLERRVLFQD